MWNLDISHSCFILLEFLAVDVYPILYLSGKIKNYDLEPLVCCCFLVSGNRWNQELKARGEVTVPCLTCKRALHMSIMFQVTILQD